MGDIKLSISRDGIVQFWTRNSRGKISEAHAAYTNLSFQAAMAAEKVYKATAEIDGPQAIPMVFDGGHYSVGYVAANVRASMSKLISSKGDMVGYAFGGMRIRDIDAETHYTAVVELARIYNAGIGDARSGGMDAVSVQQLEDLLLPLRHLLDHLQYMYGAGSSFAMDSTQTGKAIHDPWSLYLPVLAFLTGVFGPALNLNIGLLLGIMLGIVTAVCIRIVLETFSRITAPMLQRVQARATASAMLGVCIGIILSWGGGTSGMLDMRTEVMFLAGVGAVVGGVLAVVFRRM